MTLNKRQIADAAEIAERHYPRRQFWGGFTPPSKSKETPMRTPEEEAYDRQAAEDRRNNDRIEAVLTPPRDPEIDRLIAEQQARDKTRANADPDAMRREMEVRAGMLDPAEAGLRPGATSQEITASAKRHGWDQAHRLAYLRAIEGEQIARQASRGYEGAA